MEQEQSYLKPKMLDESLTSIKEDILSVLNQIARESFKWKKQQPEDSTELSNSLNFKLSDFDINYYNKRLTNLYMQKYALEKLL